jgi:hypothetical protein
MISFVSLGLMCITLFLSCKTNEQTEVEELTSVFEVPEKIISPAKAAILFRNDETTRLSQIGKKNVSFQEKIIHFELAELENYLQRLETIAISKEIPITGISFVFGATNDGKRTTFIMPSIHNTELDYQESFTLENGKFITFTHIDEILSKHTHSINDENLILSTNGYLSFNEAVTLFNTYEQTYIQAFAEKVSKEYYTKAVWYSLAEIKEYIQYLHTQSAKHQLAITGIDVFFGVYDKNPELELKSNAQTLFLAPSRQNQTIINNQATLLNTFLENDFLYKDTTSDEDESLAYNMGQLSPPPVNN